jgi:hypothetical protein
MVMRRKSLVSGAPNQRTNTRCSRNFRSHSPAGNSADGENEISLTGRDTPNPKAATRPKAVRAWR